MAVMVTGDVPSARVRSSRTASAIVRPGYVSTSSSLLGKCA